MSTSTKTHKVKGISFNRKKFDNYVRFRIEKGRIQIKVYEAGKTTIKNTNVCQA